MCGGGVRSWDRHVEEDRGARSNRDRNKLSHSLSIREIVFLQESKTESLGTLPVLGNGKGYGFRILIGSLCFYSFLNPPGVLPQGILAPDDILAGRRPSTLAPLHLESYIDQGALA